MHSEVITKWKEEQISNSYLSYASPQDVFRYINEVFVDHSPNNDLERMLLARDEPLVDLAIAAVTSSRETLATIYKKARATNSEKEKSLRESQISQEYASGLRVACLSNANVGKWSLTKKNWIENILGEDEYARIVLEGGDVEILALFSNPTLGQSVLNELYLKEGIFSSVSESRRISIVSAASHNPLLSSWESERHSKASDYQKVYDAVFGLLQNAQVSEKWIHPIISTLDPMLRPQSPPKESQAVLEVFARWEKCEIEGSHDDYQTSLPLREALLCRIASLYGFSVGLKSNIDHPDLASRCAHYASVKMSKAQMKAGMDRDGYAYLAAVLFNDHIFLDFKLRMYFETEQLCIGESYHLDKYHERCQQLSKKRSFYPNPVSNELRQTFEARGVKKIDNRFSPKMDFGGWCRMLFFFVLLCVLRGWALSTLWNWFAVPTFSLPQLGTIAAIGLALPIGIFRGAHEISEGEKLKLEQAVDPLGLISDKLSKEVSAILGCVSTGWLVHFFI